MELTAQKDLRRSNILFSSNNSSITFNLVANVGFNPYL
jgi:hypothetical protein